jgi:glucose-1-phosphate thymidylyltransferase
MIYYPLLSLVNACIKEILISSSPDHAGQFATLLKGGDEFGVKLYYSVQENPKGGIAHAIGLAEEFAKGDKLTVVLGDNIFSYNLKSTVEKFKNKEKGAMVFGIKMPEMESKHYGVIEIDSAGRSCRSSKPEKPKSNIAQTGIYL